MIFEFIIDYHKENHIDILDIIRKCLTKVLEDNLNEFESNIVEGMVIPRVERLGDEININSQIYRSVLFGFSIDLPDETASPRIVIDEFTEALDIAPVVHVTKFEDPLLRIDLARWSEEIYNLELKLRRVLTIIYLHAYQGNKHYDLLCDESVQPLNKERPKADQMKERAENQLFYLTFGQYAGLNQRPELKLPELMKLIQKKDVYDSFREEISRLPIRDKEDSDLISGLHDRMDPIESMRNCCAHSRRPSKKVEANYINSMPLLHQLLNNYLTRWEWQQTPTEP